MEPNRTAKVSLFSVVTIIINSVLFCIYIAARQVDPSLFVLVVIGCLPAICLPIISKYFRVQRQQSGKALEIISLIFALLMFWSIYFNLTNLPLWPAPYILMAIPVLIYTKCFNYVDSTTISQEPESPSLEKTDPDTSAPTAAYCRKCGNKLPSHNTLICENCGMKTQYALDEKDQSEV